MIDFGKTKYGFFFTVYNYGINYQSYTSPRGYKLTETKIYKTKITIQFIVPRPKARHIKDLH